MDDPVMLWMIGLFVLAAALMTLEIFIPSGGLLGAAAALCALGAVGMGFRISTPMGILALVIVAVSTPTAAWMAVKIMPNTPIGRKIILSEGSSEDDLQRRSVERSRETEAITALVGATGTAITDLRPGGTARVEGEDIEVFAEVGYIERGTDVEITRIAGRQIRVRPVEA